MKNKYLRIFAPLISICLIVIGCGKPEENHRSTVHIQIPETQRNLNQTVGSLNQAGGWSDVDPTTLDDIVCFAIAVEGPEASTSNYTCKNILNEEVMHPFVIAGTVATGGEIELDVPAGIDRTFYVLGFGATSLEACLAFTLLGFPDRANLSPPHIIGQKTVDLVPGEIDLEIEISMNGATKFNECTGDFLNPDPAVIEILGPSSYDYGDKALGSVSSHIFTLDNTGGSTATEIQDIGLAPPFNFTGGTFPGTGGTCTASLGTDQTCTISVAYSPTAAANPVTDTLVISYKDGYEYQTTSESLTAIASVPAMFTAFAGGTYNFGNVVRTLTSEHTITLTNNGDYLASSMSVAGLAPPFNFKGGSYPGTGGDCGSSLAKTLSCTIVVEFTPPTPIGAVNDNLEFSFENGAGLQMVTHTLNGNGVSEALLTINNGPSYDFGTVARGSSSNFILQITNSGGDPATSMVDTGLSAPYSFTGGSYPGTSGNCGATLGAGASCNIQVNYSPTVNGASNDFVDISYFDALASQNATREIKGVAADPALLTISNPSYDYGTLATGASTDFTFTLNNTGGVTATGLGESGLAAPFGLKGGPWPGAGGTCTTTIAAGANCTIVVTYSPVGVGGDGDTIQVDYNDGVGAVNITNGISGTGANPASLSLSDGPTYDFGNVIVGSTGDYAFTLSNSGGVAATSLSEIGIAGDFSFPGGYPGTTGTCTGTLAAGANCTLLIRYTPGTAAVNADSIQINYHTGVVTTNIFRSIQGTGVNSALLVISEANPYSYGTQAIGSSTSYMFTISNTGGVTATSMAGTGLTSPFNYTGGSYPGGGSCGATLLASSNCTIFVDYDPVGATVSNDSIQIDYNDGLGSQSGLRDVTGTGAAPAVIVFLDGSPYDYGSQASSSNTDYTFTIQNTGGVTATSIAGSGLAAPFNFVGGTFPGSGGTCTTSLGASSTCTLEVRFTPPTPGPYSDTLDINYNDGASPQIANEGLQGTGL